MPKIYATSSLEAITPVSYTHLDVYKRQVLSSIRKVGVERCLLSTDLGQTINPPVAEGFAMFAQRLLDHGFTVQEIRRMAVTNPTAWVQ